MEKIKKLDLLKTKIAFKKSLKKSFKSVKFVSVLSGGMSNRNYLFQVENKKYVVHISDNGYDLFVNRSDELDCLEKLKNFKYSQKPVYLSGKVRIFEFLDGTSMNEIKYQDYYKEIAESFKKLHNNSSLLKESYNPFQYLEILKSSLKSDFDSLFTESYNILQANKEMLTKRPLCLCHNDLQPSNLVLNNNEVYILDFEFAKNNDYLFDIATFGNLDFNDSLNLLKFYNENYTEEDLKVLKLWRIFVNIQWYLVAIKKYEMGYDKLLNLDFRGISMFFLSKNRDIIDSL